MSNQNDLNRTARWFCGHLYANNRKVSSIEELWRTDHRILYAKWSLEIGGKQGTAHFQFVLKMAKPVRRTDIFKKLRLIKGEWVEPVRSKDAQLRYVEKAETHVEGPWEYFGKREPNFACEVCQRDPNLLSRLEVLGRDRELIQHLLEHKKLEVKYLMNRINSI